MDRLAFRSHTDAVGFTMLSNLVLLDTALSDGAKVTYLVLLHHARQSGSCFPGQEKLATERGVSGRSVRSHLAELTARGLITTERRGKARTNLYWLESLEDIYRRNSSCQGDDRKNSSATDRKNSSYPTKERLKEESFEIESETLNVSKSSSNKIFSREAQEIATITGDSKSLRRFEQLYDIAMNTRQMGQWDEAVSSLRKRMVASEKMEPLRNPGAYFCKTLTDLLLRHGVSVPVGSKAEREDVRAQVRSSLGILAEEK